jgi:hypothetical protein
VLTSFSLIHQYGQSDITLNKLEASLLQHRNTLESIIIGALRYDSDYIFDATSFTVLKRLSFSRWQMPKDLQFTATHLKLLGPKLQTFQWDFTDNYPHDGLAWNAFGSKEETWVSEFGKAALAHRLALQNVRIMFKPDRWYSIDTGYPWDRMDRVRDEVFAPLRLELEYTTPPLTKERWLKRRQELKS